MPSQIQATERNFHDEVLVKVENVSRKFCRDLKRSLWYGLLDLGRELSARTPSTELRPGEFWASRNISFELRRGECLALVGHNGAGKTTLLKMLNGLIKPDHGRIEIRGRVGALIALGAGFNPLLTGKENVYVAASILGLSRREIASRYDEIVEFSGLHEFMQTPVQSYSSGMQVRLGFAVASSLEPDVLIIDEVLAVGDAEFRAKCYNRIFHLRRKAAVIFVSHNMAQVARLCDRALLLEKGAVLNDADVNTVIADYNARLSAFNGTGSVVIAPGVVFEDLAINDIAYTSSCDITLPLGAALRVRFTIKVPPLHETLEASLSIATAEGDLIAHANSVFEGAEVKNKGAALSISIDIQNLHLGSEPKKLSISVRDSRTSELLVWAHQFVRITPKNTFYIPSPIFLPARFTVSSILKD